MFVFRRLFRLFCFTLFAALFLETDGAFAQQEGFPHHCLPSETVFLSARMKVERAPTDSGGKRTPAKILSLCTDKPRDPIDKLSYRYGPIGAVELERVATPSNKFGYYADFDSRPITQEIYFFDIGDYSYYVRAAGWMGNGVTLHVYKGKKELMQLFSGTDDEVDFYMPFPVTPKSVYRRPFMLTAKSVLEERKPKHPFYLD